MNNKEVLNSIKRMVMNYYNHNHESQITIDDVYIVWFCKTLQNWKALAATSIVTDDYYFEITHNGDNDETYVDIYAPLKHFTVKDEKDE